MGDEKIIFSKEKNTAPILDYDDLLSILNDNRERIRTLANIVISVDGLLFSSSLVILFFSFENNVSKLPTSVIILFAVGLVCLLISVFLGILAILLPSPKAAFDKFELVNIFSATYQYEYNKIKLSAIILFISMFVFAVAMICFLTHAR